MFFSFQENSKPSIMNSLHYPPRDNPTSVMRPPSPSDLARYGPFAPQPRPVHQHNSHGSQSSCPVHGHEGGHRHEEHASRPPGLPFDPINHLPRDFHHGQHPARMREEMQYLHRNHSIDVSTHSQIKLFVSLIEFRLVS